MRGIIRISGAGCFNLLQPHIEWCQPPGRARGAYPGRLRVERLDVPTVATVFPGPRSYTGEDSVELQLPGNPILLQRVIDGLIESGSVRRIEARRAEPGEFTARAFFHGRMSLTEAEGVAATIAARSDAELRAARLLSSGALGALAQVLSDELAEALALVEAGIDFTDQEDVVAIEPGDLHARLVSLRGRIVAHLDRSVGTEQLEAIPWVVLTGAPNAGKSTLFNALLHRCRAVVSGVPGTTRDVLAEPLTIETAHGPAEIMLVDVAGADLEISELERKMQSAARAALERAELILRCVPADEPRPSVAQGELGVRTKVDLARSPLPLPAEGRVKQDEEVCVSAVREEGLSRLRRLIASRLGDQAVSLAADALALGPRHEAALRSAQGNLHEAIAIVEPSRRERHLPRTELAAASMRAALDDLASLTGEISPDDVLGRIFATFCVGK